jgi:hypothetical protein
MSDSFAIVQNNSYADSYLTGLEQKKEYKHLFDLIEDVCFWMT